MKKLFLLLAGIMFAVVSCPLDDITPVPSRFISTGVNGAHYYSDDDGVTWTQFPLYSAQDHYGIAFFKALDIVMIVGHAGDGWKYRAGRDPEWEGKSLHSGTYYDVAFNPGGIAVAVGYVYSNPPNSYDGDYISCSTDYCASWQAPPNHTPTPGDSLWSVVWHKDKFIAVGSKVMTSPDGENWTVVAYTPPAHLRGIASNGNYVVAVGGLPATGGTATVIASTDGTTWLTGNSGVSSRLHFVEYDPNAGRFIAGGWEGVLITSDNIGATWTPRSSGSTSHLNSAAYGNGVWVVVSSNSVAYGPCDVLYSNDHGLTWNKSDEILPPQYGVCYRED